MKTVIKGGHIVNEGSVFDGDIIIEDGNIIEVSTSSQHLSPITQVIDATGCYVLPEQAG